MKSKRPNFETSKRPKDEGDQQVNDGALGLNDDLDVWTLRRLDVCEAPDLTRRIMGRLGYMQVSRRVARRERLRRWANRSGIMLAAAVAIGIGVRIYESGPDVRRANEWTVPAAIGNDVQRHQERIGNVIRTIRNLTPVAPAGNPAQFDVEDAESDSIESERDPTLCAPWGWV